MYTVADTHGLPSNCRSFSAKEPIIIALFCGTWYGLIQDKNPTGRRHPVKLDLEIICLRCKPQCCFVVCQPPQPWVAVWRSVLQCVAACCSVLQRVAGCCSVSQGVAVCCSVALSYVSLPSHVLQCGAVCLSVLQCVAVCCSVLQGVAVCRRVLQCVAVLLCRMSAPPAQFSKVSNTLQHTATHCNFVDKVYYTSELTSGNI